MTSSANCVRAPARRLTAVCEVPPPDGMAPRSAPPAFASPVAANSWFGRRCGSSLVAKARPAAIVSVKLISAMPRAPGQSCATSEKSGKVKDGRPRGISPTVSTPWACNPNRRTLAIAMATTISGAGARGKKCSSPINRRIMTIPTARVGSDVSGMV